jgi:hypothetical protein
MLAEVLAGCAMLSLARGAQAQAPAAPAEPRLPVSVARVRERLHRPAALKPPPEPDVPHFSAEVEEDYFPRETVLEMIRRELAADGRSVPPPPLVRPSGYVPGRLGQELISVDLIQLGLMLKNKLSAARRARAERLSRREVQEALAEFCDAHDCGPVLDQDSARSLLEGVLTH